MTIAYQSKTIDTVTAGTLLRDLGLLERRLAEVGAKTGTKYTVSWEDYPSGPPITAQMIASHVDIGSMGDYPALVNGSKTKDLPDVRSEMIAVTGYNLRGSLNGIVVPPSSKARTLKDLKGKMVSASVGSAGHGMLVKALSLLGQSPDFVQLVNQQPEVGSSALVGGQVAALAQFVPWPELLVFRKQARMLYDGGSTGVPTLHSALVRRAYGQSHPEVVKAFLASMIDATTYLQQHPVDAAERVSRATGIEPEVVYLFNGPDGLVTFDPTLKPRLLDALKGDLPFLKSLSAGTDLNVDEFVNDSYLRQVEGAAYGKQLLRYDNASIVKGVDQVCGGEITDQRAAAEAWFSGETTTRPSRTPTCMLMGIRRAEASGQKLRAGYVSDADTGARTFASAASWVEDPSSSRQSRFLPFSTLSQAEDYAGSHPGSKVEDYETALTAVQA